MRNTCVSLLFLSLLAFACNKRDDEVAWPKITPALLRVPSCGDTTDDGIFETWNSTEDSLVFMSATGNTMPSSLAVPGYLRQMSLLSHKISMSDPSFTIQAVYDTGLFWSTEFLLVNNATGDIEGRAYTSRPSNPSSDSLSQKLVLSNGTGLTAGCRRLYYYGEKTTGPIGKSNNQIKSSANILFKGHFDVEIY